MTGSELQETLAMIRDSAAGIAERTDLSRIRRLRYALPGFSREVWRSMCELGWAGLRLPSAAGGAELGMQAACALHETLGAALVPEPLTGAALVARAMAELDPAALPALLAGETLILPAWQEQPQELEAGQRTTVVAGRVRGQKSFVYMGAGADAFLVLCGQHAALVKCDAPRLSIRTLPTQDGGHYATLHFDDTPARVFDWNASAALAEATLTMAAYLVGLADEAMARTVAYLNDREQFGVPIGSFQALQHRMVDLKLQAALARASLIDAARLWDCAPASIEALAAVSRAKARTSGAALLITRQAIQMHGGIGYADEHDIGLYLRKAMVLGPAYGSPETHRRRFASLQPPVEEEA